MKFRVIGEKILVQRDSKEEFEGLVVPDAVQRPPRCGRVLAVGDEVTRIKVGEKVYFHEYAGQFLEATQDLEESDLIVMREDEVLTVLVEEEND